MKFEPNGPRPPHWGEALRNVRSPAGMLRMLNDRLTTLGGCIEAVRARVRGDNAIGRLEFGDAEFLRWK